MGYQENEELYLTLSRKELQGLCKKHGLPVNHSKIELAKMLVIYFTKKAALKERRTNRGGGSKSVGTKCDVEGNEKGNVSGGVCQRTVDASKNHGFALKESTREKARCSQIADQVQGSNATAMESMYMNAEETAGGKDQETKIQQLGYVCSHSGSGDTGQNLLNTDDDKISPKNVQPTKFRNKTSGEFSNESGLASSSEIPAEVSTPFQFFVRSEEGINLSVDLNTRSSDWINSLKDEVSILHGTQPEQSFTISDEIRDVGIVDKSSKHSGRLSKMNKNIDFNNEPISHALTSGCLLDMPTKCLDVGNQFLSPSSMTCSRTLNTVSGNIVCAADTGASVQNPAVTSSMVNKTTDPVFNVSQDKKSSKLDNNLSTDAGTQDHINVKNAHSYCQNTDVTCMDYSFNSVSNKSGPSLWGKNHDSPKPSESNGSGACQTSFVNGSVYNCSRLLDAGESNEHISEEHACSSLGNSVAQNPNSKINEKWRRSLLMKDKAHSRCSQLNKFDKMSKKACNSEVHDGFQSKKQHVDTEACIEPFRNSHSRDPKTLSRESVSDHTFLCRRSVRLVSK